MNYGHAALCCLVVVFYFVESIKLQIVDKSIKSRHKVPDPTMDSTGKCQYTCFHCGPVQYGIVLCDRFHYKYIPCRS